MNFQYDTLPQLNLPGKKAFNSISPDILEKRKIGFNAYLQVGSSVLRCLFILGVHVISMLCFALKHDYHH